MKNRSGTRRKLLLNTHLPHADERKVCKWPIIGRGEEEGRKEGFIQIFLAAITVLAIIIVFPWPSAPQISDYDRKDALSKG